MADIFRKTNADREAAAEAARIAKQAPPPGPDPATGISFTNKAMPPVDPAVEAARTAAKLKLLRDQ